MDTLYSNRRRRFMITAIYIPFADKFRGEVVVDDHGFLGSALTSYRG